MPTAIVKEFDPMKGFGTLVLETGQELVFDISVANKREPKPGDRAEVTIGTGWKGAPKAKLVVFATADDMSPTFANGIEQLRAFGFFREWDLEKAHAAAKELFPVPPARMTRAVAAAIFVHYYGRGSSERGRADGAIAFNAVIPHEGIYALAGESLALDREHADVKSLLDALNAELAERKSPNRFVDLALPDLHVIAYRPGDFEARLATTGWLQLA